MLYYIALICENGSFIGIFLISMFSSYAIYKRAKGAPGASLLSLGFFLYGIYGLLAFTGPGFTGSFFRDFSKVGVLNMDTFVYFLSFGSRIGMVFIIAGLYQLAKSSRARS